MKQIILYALLINLIISCHPKNDERIEHKQYVNSKAWIGDWDREGRMNEATLTIESIFNDTITFSMVASSGGHTGEIEGQAIIKGDTGFFHQKEEEGNCIIEFLIKGDSTIVVNQKEGNCFTGIGVTYTGKYTNSKFSKKMHEEKNDLVTLSVLDNSRQDSIFRKLVGSHYDSFVNSTQLMSEDSDLDSLNARVVSSGVRGLFTYMENIVMIDSTDNIWAAVIDDKEILYFTNRPDFANKLPNTIDKWRENFNEYEVVYKSKP